MTTATHDQRSGHPAFLLFACLFSIMINLVLMHGLNQLWHDISHLEMKLARAQVTHCQPDADRLIEPYMSRVTNPDAYTFVISIVMGDTKVRAAKFDPETLGQCQARLHRWSSNLFDWEKRTATTVPALGICVPASEARTIGEDSDT